MPELIEPQQKHWENIIRANESEQTPERENGRKTLGKKTQKNNQHCVNIYNYY